MYDLTCRSLSGKVGIQEPELSKVTNTIIEFTNFIALAVSAASRPDSYAIL